MGRPDPLPQELKKRAGIAETNGKLSEGVKRGHQPTQADLLVRCASRAELFHTPAGDAYATIPVNDHRETHPIKARGFKRWLVRGYYERSDRPPGAQALQDALWLLEARAQFDGPEREVYVRVAELEDAILHPYGVGQYCLGPLLLLPSQPSGAWYL